MREGRAIWGPQTGIFGNRVASYLAGTITTMLAFAVYAELQPALGEGSPYILFAPAIIVATFLGGARGGTLAGFLSAPLGLLLLSVHGLTPFEWAEFYLFLMGVSILVGITLFAACLVEQAKQKATKAGAMQLHADQLVRELELLIDSATHYAICMLDPLGRIVIWNKGAERIFGWTEEEVIDRYIDIFFAADEIAAGKPELNLARAREHGRFDDRGWRIRKDGSDFLASVTVAQLLDADGKEMGFGNVVRDITDEQAHADLIEAREMQLRSILATVPDAMVVMDDHSIITSFSAAAERLFGYTQAEVIGQHASLLMPNSDRQTQDYRAHYQATSERHVIDLGRRDNGRRKDGSTFVYELRIGEAIGGGKRMFTGFIRDLTAQEEAQAQLHELQAELLHISRVSAMGTMASTLAHELNQPLTAIANYVQTSQTLLGSADPDTNALVRDALSEAGAEALRAGNIVRRLREFVASGEVTKTIEPIPKLIEDACMLGMPGASEQGIARAVDLDPSLGPVLIDRIQIQQVLINLIRNAVEAMTPNGTGRLWIGACKEGAFARISVADTGPGLAPSIGDQLFKAFVSTKHDGMGLGLSICRTIIEAHGGKIWTVSAPSGGAVFHFTVPRAVPEDSYA